MEETSPLAYVGACLGMAGGFYGLFAAAEENLKQPAKDAVAKLVRRTRVDAPDVDWATTFQAIFDSIYTDRHLSWGCFWRSCVSSYLAVVAVCLISLAVGLVDVGDWNLDESGAWSVFVLFLVFPATLNFLPDYLSLLETRYVLKLLSGEGRTVKLVVADLILTFLIASVGIVGAGTLFFSQDDLIANSVEFVFEMAGFDSPVSIFFYSTFLTSVWIWLYLLGLGVLRFLQGFAWGTRFLHSNLNIEDKPLRAIGFVSMVLIVGMFAVAAPFVLL